MFGLSPVYRFGLCVLALSALGVAGVVAREGMGVPAADLPDGEQVQAQFERLRPHLDKLWAGIETHSVPLVIAALTFLATVVYHRVRGKSLRESPFGVTDLSAEWSLHSRAQRPWASLRW